MSQKDIPRSEWKKFCKQFSEQHQGWLVTLTDIHADSQQKNTPEARLVAQNLALRHIYAERENGHLGLRIVAGDGARKITHFVLDPAKIHLEKTRYGIDRGIRISDSSNQSTVVRFNVPQIS